MSGVHLAEKLTDMSASATCHGPLLALTIGFALLSWAWLCRPRAAAVLSAALTAAGAVTWALLPLFPVLLLALPTACLLAWWLPRLRPTPARVPVSITRPGVLPS